MNHKKILIGLFVFLAVAVVLLFVAKAAKDKKDKAAKEATAPTAPTATAATPQAPAAPANVASYPIVYNKFSEAVKPLQVALGVTADGILGANTLRVMNEALVKTNKATHGITIKINNSGELQYLLNAVAEAKNSTASLFNYNLSWLNPLTIKS